MSAHDSPENPAHEALADLMPRIYEELRDIAHEELRNERANHTLQPTAVVHEAYLRISRRNSLPGDDLRHFRAVAAREIRRVLIDYARRRLATRRNQGQAPVTLQDEVAVLPSQPPVDFLALEESLQGLAEKHPRKVQLVELRFYGGLGLSECAEVLGISVRVAAEDWSFARAWLRRDLEREWERDE